MRTIRGRLFIEETTTGRLVTPERDPPRKGRPPVKWRPTTPSRKQVQRGNAFLKP